MRSNFSSWHWDSLAYFALGTSSWFFGSLPLEFPLAFIYRLGANTTQTVLWCWVESMQSMMESPSFGCVLSILPFSGKTYGELLWQSSISNTCWTQSSQSAWFLLESVIMFLSSPSLLHHQTSRRKIHQGSSTCFLRLAAPSAHNICGVLDQYALQSLQGSLPSYFRSSWLYNGKNHPLHLSLHGH